MTPTEKALVMVSEEEWDWANNPTKAITYASVVAAEHRTEGRDEPARYWTEVSARLSAIAGTPVGLVVNDLLNTYGISLDQ